MQIVLAPNTLKGSLSSQKATDAMCLGILKASPQSKIIPIPLADGGDSVLEVLCS